MLGLMRPGSTLFLLTTLVAATPAGAGQERTRQEPVGVIHATDLFRPHNDPDDHWDLACIYALAHRGDIRLEGILIDHPPDHPRGYQPDIAAVAQMNRITGLAVPVAVGAPPKPGAEVGSQGVAMVLRILERSPRPVFINVVGSCRDIAAAGRSRPELFARKCAGIYLNAGTGGSGAAAGSKVEYNVSLDVPAYQAIFAVPCPIYWMPCFERLGRVERPKVPQYGTHYKFRQGEILPHLSRPVQNYFLGMFAACKDHRWLAALAEKPDGTLLARVEGEDRHMWCTAGFFHLAGFTITGAGRIVPRRDAKDAGVFTFLPIRITAAAAGRFTWVPDPASRRLAIFRVVDTDHYGKAVTKAMARLLGGLP